MDDPIQLADSPPPGIALVDLDGTLVAWDLQLVFRHFVIRRHPWRRALLPLFLLSLPIGPWIGSDGLKRVFLSYLWRIDPEILARDARDFAQAVLPCIYPQLRERLDAQRRAGHLMILASASPEFYVTEIGRLLDFDLVLGTQVCPGRLIPPLVNHKGATKVTRLRHLLPTCYFDATGRLHAAHGYTDSCADLPMLDLCATATVVNPSPDLQALAVAAGWEILRPPRPWHNRLDRSLRLLAMLIGIGRNPAGLASQI